MEDINDILAKHFSSTELTTLEKTQLDNWKIDNKLEYESLVKSWESVPEFNYNTFDTDTAWQKIDSKIVEKETKIFSIKPFLKYAIAASIALLITVGGYNLFGLAPSSEFLAFENNSNAVKTLKLKDGTVIYVGKHSTIKYQNNFANHRNIKLDGEAFFDVNRDEQHPFIIETTYGDIEVLGTSFNINTLHKNTVVSVKSGRVELRNNDSKIILVKNESASSNGSKISTKKVVSANYLSWKTGEFIFENTPINEVILSLNSYYNTQIILGENINQNQPFTGQFNNQKLDDIIEAIILSCNLVSEKNNNQIIIK